MDVRKYGQIDPASKTIIDSFAQFKTVIEGQAYFLSLVAKDMVERERKENASPDALITDENVKLIRREILVHYHSFHASSR